MVYMFVREKSVRRSARNDTLVPIDVPVEVNMGGTVEMVSSVSRLRRSVRATYLISV